MSDYTIILGMFLVLAVLFDVYAYYRFQYSEEVAASMSERKARKLKSKRFESGQTTLDTGADAGSESEREREFDEFEDAQPPEGTRETRGARQFGDAYFVGSTREDAGGALLEMSDRLENLSERVDSLRRQLGEAMDAREARGSRGGGLKYVPGEGFKEFKDVAPQAGVEEGIPEVSFGDEGNGSESAGEEEPEDEEFGSERKVKPRRAAKKTRRK